jgi:BirA family transcriptional regulator, biotin operon repressor / biotin---[acetyl-CoA-carboxylase] ligase
MQLDPSAAAAGVRLVVHDTVGSTSTEALARARAGDAGPLWVVARRQTAGRGRGGRTWVSEPGNLYASLLLTDPSPPAQAPELSFVSALALHDALADLAPELERRLAFKWPNDLLANGAKIAGILVEGETVARPARDPEKWEPVFGKDHAQENRFAVAIGIGVNCSRHPSDASYASTDLAALGFELAPAAVFRALSATFVRRLRQWERGAGFATVRRDWLARAGGVGEPIRVRTGRDQLDGIFAALDPTGRLVLTVPDGTTHVIGAGEVFPSLAEPAQLARDPEKACPGLDPGWEPVFGRDHAQSNKLARDGGSKKSRPTPGDGVQ